MRRRQQTFTYGRRINVWLYIFIFKYHGPARDIQIFADDNRGNHSLDFIYQLS
jgi:hypothetical protein